MFRRLFARLLMQCYDCAEEDTLLRGMKSVRQAPYGSGLMSWRSWRKSTECQYSFQDRNY